MTVATLSEVLQKAKQDKYAVAGLVVLGWEDARCYAETAEELGLPVILQAGPGCRANTPLPILGKMFRYLAEKSKTPVVCHLDHGYTKEECVEAINSGFSSIMFDGSKFELQENIEKTHEIAEIAHQHHISIEGEIGFVGYAEGAESKSTDPAQAKAFAEQSKCDAMAISVGNVHLQTSKSSSIEHSLRRTIANTTNVCKFNIGTELRKTFGDTLRKEINNHPTMYDRIQLINLTKDNLKAATRLVLENISKF